MKVLVTGSGGREHALAWRIVQSAQVEKVFVAPGNAGTALDDGLENIAIGPMDFDDLIAFAKEEDIDLTVVGPEDPLVEGVVDAFSSAGLRCFGPSKLAAQLEGSKSFTKAFLEKYNIPTGSYEAFEEPEAAIAYIRDDQPPFVIKADGLAAGKGVVIAQDHAEAEVTIRDMLSGNLLG
ncbi:MAG: phosphoribosylamine--glycine ligase, partial [Gammaproteobacteria bacterium]|nr:phosphoribosylamine--glycine ligase [Gammaproteobacteria bacterium]